MRYTVEISDDGECTSWYKEGTNIRHREGSLPAYEQVNGYKAWYVDGKFHRENGPAVIYSSGAEAFYLNGKYIPNIYSFKAELNSMKKDSCEGKVVEIYGKKYKLTSI
jgi:hypothetical protein